MSDKAMKRPDIEVKRRIRRGRDRGAMVSYGHIYWRPLIVHILGRTIIGKRHLR